MKKMLFIIFNCFLIFSLCACTSHKVSLSKPMGVQNSKIDHNTDDNKKPTNNPVTPTTFKEAEKTIKENDTSEIPILYYHSVSDNIFGIKELFVSVREFEEQMKFLNDNGYTPISFGQLDNLGNIEKPVIITFDDGYENNYLEAYPVLKKYGFKAVIFVCTDFIGGSSMLKEHQIREMSDLVSFQSHTLSHPDLTKLNADKLHYELSESKKVIEGMTGEEVYAFAYPTGYYNKNVIEAVKKYYKYAVLNVGGLYVNGVDNYEIKRVYIPRGLDIKSFREKLIRGTLN